MNVLLISYYFDPYPGVGAKRMSYWARKFNERGDEVTIITTSDGQNDFGNRIVIEPAVKGPFISRFIQDPGLSWLVSLKNHFSKITEARIDYDVVIISGGPFMHFSIAKMIKNKFGAKILLDFRDPFAINPRFEDGWLKKRVKAYFEKQFILNADGIITVNKFCGKLIKTFGKPLYIIENGYDEEQLTGLKQKEKSDRRFILSHAGSLYADRDPSNLMSCIANHFSDEVIFEQFGTEPELLKPFQDKTFYRYRGNFDYKDLLEELTAANACVLITKGDPFESTTKVFDYIALNKKILIITSGDLKSGNLNEITMNYPNVVWVNNQIDQILKGIQELIEMEEKSFDSHPFSRLASFDRLLKAIKEL